MSKKKEVFNPNTVANPVFLPDVKDNVASVAKDIKNDNSKVSLGPDSKR